MPSAMILLVGEQPAPNLLPTRRLKPDVALLVYTGRTQQVAKNLEKLLRPICPCWLCPVPPYDILGFQAQVKECISDKLAKYDLIFNLTGGTKPMALSAFELARANGAPFIYFQTEGNHSRLYHYTFEGGNICQKKVEELTDSITLADYLKMYLGAYDTGNPRDEFERQVEEELRAHPRLELLWGVRPQGLAALEIDFVTRLGNQIGVGEVKTKGAKSGIDQINSVAEQRYLGTYVKKFLISGKRVDRNNKNLAKAYRIEVIELLSYSEIGVLNVEDRQKLAKTVFTQLGG